MIQAHKNTTQVRAQHRAASGQHYITVLCENEYCNTYSICTVNDGVLSIAQKQAVRFCAERLGNCSDLYEKAVQAIENI